MKLAIVTGSRDWTSRTAIWSALDQEQPNIVMHGSCESLKGATQTLLGADLFADEWARRFGVMLLTAPALFSSSMGTRAGPIRNTFMAKAAAAILAGWETQPHQAVVIAAPLGESRGTRDMMAKAEKRGWRVRLVEPDTGEE
jgi:hypothetical protein